MDRLWEIDFLRGIAIIMMISVHIIFDLWYFGYSFDLDIGTGFWFFFARITASIFVFLVGVSLTLSYSRTTKKTFRKYAYRGIKIFSCGLIITAITLLFLRSGFVFFGVLHFIGVAIILAYFFLRFHRLNLIMGITIILVGIYLQGLAFNFPWLLWLGFMPYNLYTIDYFPLLPWFGLVLLGLFFGRALYPDGNRRIRHVDNQLTKFFCLLGRRSLIIYLIHQPILVGLLHVFVL